MNPETVQMLRSIFIAVAPLCAMGAAIVGIVYAFSASSNWPTGTEGGAKKDINKALRAPIQEQFAFVMGLLFIGLAVGAIAIEYLLSR